MSRGNTILTFRIDGGLQEDMELAIASRNEHSREAPWTTTDFIRLAIREKIDKGIRSRRARRNKKGSKTA